VSIDKVVIQGAEFTRVADKYLLQSEVEQALARTMPAPVPHLERLTTLLEDIVSTADAVALEVMESGSLTPSSKSQPAAGRAFDDSARALLKHVRDSLHDQIVLIDDFLQRVDG